MTMDTRSKIDALLSLGFVVGHRDPRINADHDGFFMVAESYDQKELPTQDGSTGPWAIVGNDLTALVDEAYALNMIVPDIATQHAEATLSEVVTQVAKQWGKGWGRLGVPEREAQVCSAMLREIARIPADTHETIYQEYVRAMAFAAIQWTGEV
jgi:hypothetical protein